MLVLITYDVNTETGAGKTRLRKVARQCVNYGTRVQNSVFECVLDPGQCLQLKAILTDIIDESVDSLRFYYLGSTVTAAASVSMLNPFPIGGVIANRVNKRNVIFVVGINAVSKYSLRFISKMEL